MSLDVSGCNCRQSKIEKEKKDAEQKAAEQVKIEKEKKDAELKAEAERVIG